MSGNRSLEGDDKPSLWLRVLMVMFIFGPVCVFLMLPLYIIGAVWAVIHTCLEVGYEIGVTQMSKFIDSFDRYK